MPTYKHDIRSKEYDTSKKQRVPAFCDRILWKRSANLKQLYYHSVPSVDFTDHRPVVSHFQLRIDSKEKPSRRPAFVEYLQDAYNQLQQSDDKLRAGGQSQAGEPARAFAEFQTRQDSRIVVDSDDDDDGQDIVNDEFDSLEAL